MEKIIKTLIERGYPENAAKHTANNLMKMAPELQEALQDWIDTGKMPVMKANDYSTDVLMTRFQGMTYPAALLTIDWLIRDPQKAAAAIEKGIR